MSLKPLSNVTALVIGADTRIGRAVVSKLSGQGARVAALASTEQELAGAELALRAELLDEVALSAAFEQVHSQFGHLNLLVFCQGQPAVGGLLEQSLDEFWAHQDQLLSASFLISRLASPLLKAAGWGRVVLNSSGWSQGGANLAAVATAAGGVQLLCKTLARELGPHGITVNALAHAFSNSEWLAADAAALGLSQTQVLEQAAQLVPAGHLGSPAELANSIALLCHPTLGAATAQTLQCSGGYFRRRT